MFSYSTDSEKIVNDMNDDFPEYSSFSQKRPLMRVSVVGVAQTPAASPAHPDLRRELVGNYPKICYHHGCGTVEWRETIERKGCDQNVDDCNEATAGYEH